MSRKNKIKNGIGLAIIATIVGVGGTRGGCSRTEWTNDAGTKYTTIKNLWGTPIERMVHMADGSWLSGPLSKSGKRHGRWFYCDSKNDYRDWWWYWYGEKCTEGEFRRWSK